MLFFLSSCNWFCRILCKSVRTVLILAEEEGLRTGFDGITLDKLHSDSILEGYIEEFMFGILKFIGKNFLLNTGISQSPSHIFCLPSKTICFCFTATIRYLSKRIVQSLSAICPRDISDALFKSNIINAFVALGDNKGDSDILPCSFDFIINLFGRVTLVPSTCSRLDKTYLSHSRQ